MESNSVGLSLDLIQHILDEVQDRQKRVRVTFVSRSQTWGVIEPRIFVGSE